jgi:1-acyl-sn-glycerol-3-phosphate acyltransferase
MSASYESAVRFIRVVLRAFFRRIEVAGLEQVPTQGGGVIVAWHPNGLVDPALILACCPREVAFGARHGLFRVPVLGWVMRGVGAVPIYRARDAGTRRDQDRRAQNQKSLERLAEAVQAGRFAALFPEGSSHDAPRLMELKTGAARLYYRARELAPGVPPAIVPVGLHYDDKRAFRSRVLVEFHTPLELPPGLDVTPTADESEEAARERGRELTRVIEQELHDVVHATESWELHHLMHRARKLVRAERALRAKSELEPPNMREKVLGFARIWAGYEARSKTHPAEVAELVARLSRYHAALAAMAIEDHELDQDPRLASPWLGWILLLQLLTVYLVLPPVLIVGWLVNLPVALGLLVLSKAVARAYKDEATVKVLVGSVAFPLAWIAAGIGAAKTHVALHQVLPGTPTTPLVAGIAFALLGAAGGAVALRYIHVARETARAVRVRLFRRWRKKEVERLRRERAALFDAIMPLAAGLELPGVVGEDGRVLSRRVPT